MQCVNNAPHIQASKHPTPSSGDDDAAAHFHVSLHSMIMRDDAIDQHAPSLGKTLHRSLSWTNVAFRRHGGSPSVTQARSTHAARQERDPSSPIPRIAPLICNSDSASALSPLRHVYSTAGVSNTSSLLLRSASHASTSSTASSSASRTSAVSSISSMACSITASPTEKMLSLARSRPEHGSMSAAAQLDGRTCRTSSKASWTVLPCGHCPMPSGTAKARFQMQEVSVSPRFSHTPHLALNNHDLWKISGLVPIALRFVQAECLVLTIRDTRKQRLSMLFHSPYATIGQVKEQIQSQMGNTVSQQQLTYKGLLLQDDVSLGSFIRGSAAVLHLSSPFHILRMW